MNDRTNAIALVSVSIPSLAMSEAELIQVLQGSVYPGAKVESIKLVIGYCKAQNLDPILKPVHIVPMDVPTGRKDADGWDITEKRDVVMPGIGLYRIQASRTNEHVGTGEPEFGPDVVTKLGETEITFPAWCRVTVKRLKNGVIAEYPATERWLENYATKGRNKKDANKMWAKRPYAQLAKCAEAQALRKGFPEVGAQPTAEEMEGKALDEGVTIDGHTGAVVPQIQQPQGKSEPKATVADVKPVDADSKPAPESMKKMIRARIESAGVAEVALLEKFEWAGPAEKFWADLTLDRGNEILKWLAQGQ